MKNQNTKKLAYAALFLALCLVLPMLTGQIPQIGSMLLPMHIPVLLCGLVCGWQYGGGKAFTAQAFLAGALLNAVPGIIVQLILIPAVMAALQKAGAVKQYAE